MKKVSLFVLTILLISCASASVKNQKDVQTIFLVRHAEKANDGTKDPPLTKEGMARAKTLASMLASKGIKSVISTDFKRTRDTAKPLADELGINVIIYNHKTPQETAAQLLDSGENTLVVGHSNSTPALTNLLLGEEKYAQLSEKEYSKLFIVTKIGDNITSEVVDF